MKCPARKVSMSQNLSASHVRLLGPWRRRWQGIVTLTILLLPFGQINQVGLLRLNFSNLSIEFFGAVLRIEELYLLLIFSLTLILFFLLGTLVSGRVWCGWMCPQTTLGDLYEWLGRRLGLSLTNNRFTGKAWRRLLLHLITLALALLVGSNLLLYFLAPQTFFAQLFTGQLHPVALGTLLLIAAAVYFDLTWLRRAICRDFCPYGRFQTVLIERGTLSLSLPTAEKPRCIQCNSCVRACPMGIDIRQGDQIECINCGRCLDACRQVMAKRGEPGLIGYHFGSVGQSWRALLNFRTLLLAGLAIGLSLLLFVAIHTKSPATLKVSLSHQAASRQLANGDQLNFFNAWVNNRTTKEISCWIEAKDAQSRQNVQLKGQTHDISLKPGENRKLDFILISPANAGSWQVEFYLKNSTEILAQSQALITPNSD